MGTMNPTLALSGIELVSGSSTQVDLARVERAFALDPADWMAGSSAAITLLRAQIRRIAPYFRTALLTGEPGCGELAAARMLHELSPRCEDEFLELTPELAEQLLGAQEGCAPLVAYGMIFLPQPERLSRTAQRSLLRMLRERGARAPRVVAFTERGMRSLVAQGGFSPELADALGVLQMTLPPLRERREDTAALLKQMVNGLATRAGVIPPELAADLLETAARAPWPGNLAQMQSVAEGLLGCGGRRTLRAVELTAILAGLPPAPPRERRAIAMVSLDTVVQQHLRAVLLACHGNKLRAAEVLGISRSTLYRMLEAQGAAGLAEASSRLPMAG